MNSLNICQRYEFNTYHYRYDTSSLYVSHEVVALLTFALPSAKLIFSKYTQAETLRNKPWFTANKAAHGHNGPVVTAPHDPAPISSLVLESYQSMGLPLIPDMFSSGESARGCGHVVRTIYQGTRTTAADYITKSNARGNISIRTKTYIDRVSLEKNDHGLRASGVYLQGADGQKSFVRARKEIIVSAGTYGTPAILIRSGIGAKQEIGQLGIKNQVDLPGVGKNLMDHLVSSFFSNSITIPNTLPLLVSPYQGYYF
jgi:choline dehydrogenase-like flavoprotein